MSLLRGGNRRENAHWRIVLPTIGCAHSAAVCYHFLRGFLTPLFFRGNSPQPSTEASISSNWKSKAAIRTNAGGLSGGLWLAAFGPGCLRREYVAKGCGKTG